MLNIRLAGGHLVSLMTFFVLSLFPLDVLDEIRDLIESVSEGFLTYSSMKKMTLFPDNGHPSTLICNANKTSQASLLTSV